MTERFFLVLAALAGALVIGATAAYGVARPGDRIGTGLIKSFDDPLPAPQRVALKERD